jgi:hypothetical protein
MMSAGETKSFIGGCRLGAGSDGGTWTTGEIRS